MTGCEFMDCNNIELRQAIINKVKACTVNTVIRADLLFTAWLAIDNVEHNDKSNLYYRAVAARAIEERRKLYYPSLDDFEAEDRQKKLVRKVLKFYIKKS